MDDLVESALEKSRNGKVLNDSTVDDLLEYGEEYSGKESLKAYQAVITHYENELEDGGLQPEQVVDLYEVMVNIEDQSQDLEASVDLLLDEAIPESPDTPLS